MRTDKILHVLYKERRVGTLAMTADRKIAFVYDDDWLENGFPISPFSLPLKRQVFVARKDYFDGLFGVFADSLPDAWGNILLNRLLKKNGLDSGKVNILDRLAIVGASGMGALTYQPEYKMEMGGSKVDLDEMARECQKILKAEHTEDLDELYRLGGTSGGARPKIMTEVDGEGQIPEKRNCWRSARVRESPGQDAWK